MNIHKNYRFFPLFVVVCFRSNGFSIKFFFNSLLWRFLFLFFLFFLNFQVQTANNLLLLHLGVVDSLLCVTFLVFSAPEMLRGWAWLGLGAPCNLHGFLFTLLHPVALWTVCGLNCDRYYAITSPLHYGAMVSPKKVILKKINPDFPFLEKG